MLPFWIFSQLVKGVHLNWKTVEGLEKEYMRNQLKGSGLRRPMDIVVDEISIRKGHSCYRIVVRDLLRRRSIWFGCEDRSEASVELFLEELSTKKSRTIVMAVTECGRLMKAQPDTRSPGGYPVRQVSCDASSQRCLGQGAQARVRTVCR